MKEKIISTVLLIGIIVHYFANYWFWEVSMGNIYRITLYFCLDIWGLAILLLAKKKWLKWAAVIGMVFGSYSFYTEYKSDEGFKVFVMITINVIFMFIFTELIKTKNDGTDSTNS